MIKLSIITINYNNAEGLRKTLASVASQTYAEIEHIIIDGGSTDESVEILRAYPQPLPKGRGEEPTPNPSLKGGEMDAAPKYSTDANRDDYPHQNPAHKVLWVSEKDSGIYNAMNKGIEIALGRRIVNKDHTSSPLANRQSPIAQTDYIQILNAGDILAAPDVTERMVDALKAHQCKVESVKCKGNEDGEADTPASRLSPFAYRLENCPAIFYGNMIKEYPDGHRLKDTCGSADYTPESFLYFYKGTLNHDCAYIRKDLFEKYGLYNEQMKICSDWEWYVRAIVLGGEKPIYTNIDVTIFDMTGISESNGKNKELIQKERREYLESILPQSILHDYDMYSLPLVQYQRLKKYHLWGIVHFVERVLFKLERVFRR